MALLATKLYLPTLGGGVLSRPHLVERLNDGLGRKLTLLSAPAGFGKTTLVTEWMTRCGRRAAWLTLDEADGELGRFLGYVVAALRTISPDLCTSGPGAQRASEDPPAIEPTLTALLNEISTIPQDMVLVLDDYQAIDSKPVDHAVTFLLDHLPRQLHIVIASREDPRLPLARLRARGQMTELRAAELRFTTSESAEFLTKVMGLGLSREDLDRLDGHTEGWIAGLQLAALSMRGHAAPSEFTRSFTGSNRFVLDYLLEEVLQRQPPRVRDFLLQTSILDRMTASLCGAVTAQKDAQDVLEALERGNFFIVPLDDVRQWFRYHRLFASVLAARLVVEQPDQLSVLHRRASEWYERHGALSDAIRHSLAASDFDRAARLIELIVPEMRRTRQEATVLGWIRALPDDVVRCRPVLSVQYAWALLTSGELDAVGQRLDDAERWLAPAVPSIERAEDDVVAMMVANQDEFQRLPASIALYRAGHAQQVEDHGRAANQAERVLQLVSEDDPLMRGAALGMLALAYWSDGRLEDAHETFAAGMRGVQRAGYTSDAINGTLVLADIRIAQGRLHEARRTYEQALRDARQHEGPVSRGVPDVYVGLSELHRELNELDSAARYLRMSDELGVQSGLPRNHCRWFTAMAGVSAAQGSLDDALDLLDHAERHQRRDYFPLVRPVHAMKTRVWLAQHRLNEALDWMRLHKLSAHDDLAYLREYEHITVARILLHRYESNRMEAHLEEANSLLQRLLAAAADGGRTASVLEILVLQALAIRAEGDRSRALVPLSQALALAAAEGHVRVFLDEGSRLAELLRRLAGQHDSREERRYARKLLAIADVRRLDGSVEAGDFEPSVASGRIGGAASALDALSPRELEVLRLIGAGLSNQQIGERLFRALSTIKGHNKIIFDKLGVRSRTEAVARARELGLL